MILFILKSEILTFKSFSSRLVGATTSVFFCDEPDEAEREALIEVVDFGAGALAANNDAADVHGGAAVILGTVPVCLRANFGFFVGAISAILKMYKKYLFDRKK